MRYIPDTGPATYTAIKAPKPKAKLTDRKLARTPRESVYCAMPEHPNRTRIAVPNNSATHSAHNRTHGLREGTASKRIPSKMGRSTKISERHNNK